MLVEALARDRGRAATAPRSSGAKRAASSLPVRRPGWSGRRPGTAGRAGPRASRPGCARASARSCRGPCRRRGCRPGRTRAGTAARQAVALVLAQGRAQARRRLVPAARPKPRSFSASARSRSPPSQRSCSAASFSASATAWPSEIPSVPSADSAFGSNSSISVSSIGRDGRPAARHPPVREPREERAAHRDLGRPRPSRPGTRCSIARQHRQQRHPLAVDHDAQIEREPGTCRLAEIGLPIACSLEDVMPEARLDRDPPAFRAQLRQAFMDQPPPIGLQPALLTNGLPPAGSPVRATGPDDAGRDRAAGAGRPARPWHGAG